METLLQRSRYEQKYLIDETRVRQIREFARHYLVPDPYADPAKGYSYCIYSIYLDNPRLDLLNATVEGHKNRFKLRVRFYDERPTSPAYFEIKRRASGTVLKERAKVRRAAANALLTPGAMPRRTDLVNEADNAGWSSLRKFCELRDKLNAAGRCLVLYDREAWLTPADNHIRLTFDRNIEGGPYDPRDPGSDLLVVRRCEQWVRPPIGGVVLELKFTDRFPNWMRELVHLFDLERCSMAKYVKCVHQMRPDRRCRARHEAGRRAERALLAGSSWEAMTGPQLAGFEIVARKGIEPPPPPSVEPKTAVPAAVPAVKALADRSGVELSPRVTAAAPPAVAVAI